MIFMSIYPRFVVLPTRKQLDTGIKYTETVRFPEQIYLISPSDRQNYGNLFIGNYEAALNLQLLKAKSINAILSVAKDHQIIFPKEMIRYNKYIPLDDSSYEGYYQYILDSIDYLQSKLLLTNVIVHCVSGLKRSTWISIAYLIKHKRMSLHEAVAYIRDRVKMMEIDDQIMQILKKYEIDLQNKSPRKNKFNQSLRVKPNNSIVMSKEYFDYQNQFESLLTEINQSKNVDITDLPQMKIKSQMPNQSKSIIQKKQISLWLQNPENNNHSMASKKSQSVGLVSQKLSKSYKNNDSIEKARDQRSETNIKRSASHKNKKQLTLKTILKVQTLDELNSTIKQLNTELQKSKNFDDKKSKKNNK